MYGRDGINGKEDNARSTVSEGVKILVSMESKSF